MTTISQDRSNPHPRRPGRWRLILVTAFLGYAIFGVWRVFPRFDPALIGQWTNGGSGATWVFRNRGSGEQSSGTSHRKFRWWTCGNLLVKHEDRGSRSANVAASLEYALRTLLFLGPPDGMAEFEIDRLDGYGAQFTSRPRPGQLQSPETLVLRRSDL